MKDTLLKNMPGLLPHLIAGCTIFIIGKYYYRKYFYGDNKIKKLLFLAVVCLSFSFFPDFFLIIYYTTYILPKCQLIIYHNFIHIVFIPIAIVGLLVLYILNPKSKPIWIMGFWSIIFHLLMDYFIHTGGFFI